VEALGEVVADALELAEVEQPRLAGPAGVEWLAAHLERRDERA
jgi:hypothetical protein